MKRILVIFCAVLAALLIPCFAYAADGVPEKAIEARESVFRIYCQDSENQYSGSCFVIMSDAGGTYVATNRHVIESADAGSIVLKTHDGMELSLSIIVDDKDYDLCVLKTKTPIISAKPIAFSEQEDAAVGTSVYALGYPGAADVLSDQEAYRAEDVTITNGIISAIKHVTLGQKTVTLLQMNAAINFGSSGGPLVDSSGKILGINTLGINDANDLFAAVSAEHLKNLLEKNEIPYVSADQDAVPANNAPAKKSKLNLIPIIIAAGIVLAVGFIVMILYKARRRLTLAKLMKRRLHGYTYDQSIQMLAPVLKALERLHVRGEAHGGIRPDNIFVDRAGNLFLGSQKKHSVINQQTKPYLSLEQYDANDGAGTYSDMYAVGAVLYYLLTCKEPSGIMQRLQSDTLEQDIREIRDIPASAQEMLHKTLAMQKDSRIQDVFELTEHVQLPTIETSARVKQRELKKPLSKKSKRIAIAVGSASVVLVAILTAWIVNESKYQSALKHLADSDYQGANTALSGDFMFYRDVERLNTYTKAGIYLEKGYFDAAKKCFADLGNYRDAQSMVRECDYQKAKKLLNDGSALAAKALFQSLATYKDSPTWVNESDYRYGQQLLRDGKYDDSRAIFGQLSKMHYKDAATMCKEVDYQQAMALYQAFIDAGGSYSRRDAIKKSLLLLRSLGKYSDAAKQLADAEKLVYSAAQKLFSEFCEEYGGFAYFPLGFFRLIPQFEQSSKYIKVLEACGKTGKEAYKELMQYWDFQPVRDIITKKYYIYYFLVGTWRGEGRYFTVSDEDQEFQARYNLPWIDGELYKIENLTYYIGSDEKGWRKMFVFDIINEDAMYVTALKTGDRYLLRRQ